MAMTHVILPKTKQRLFPFAERVAAGIMHTSRYGGGGGGGSLRFIAKPPIMIAKPRSTSNPMMIKVESGSPTVFGPVTGTITVETTVGTITVGPLVGMLIVGATVFCAVAEEELFIGVKAASARAENTRSVRIENRFNIFLSFRGRFVEMST